MNLRTALGIFALAGTMVAAPVPPITATTGSVFNVLFNGQLTEPTQPPTLSAPVDYLSSRIRFSNFAFTDAGARTQVTFQMDITNTSGSPLTASRVGAVGFNTTPTISTSGNDVNGAFDFVTRNSPMPASPFVTTVEFCVANGHNCSGGGDSGGLAPGVNQGTTGTAYATLFFNGAGLRELTFDNLYVRYTDLQGVRGYHNGVGSPVPETSSYVVMISGLALVAFRRKIFAKA